MATIDDIKHYSPDFQGLGIQTGLLTFTATVSMSLFLFIRNRPNYAHLYQNHFRILKHYNPFLSLRGFDLFTYIVRMRHTDLLKYIGLDQYLYCTYLGQLSKILLSILFIPLILMPLHYLSADVKLQGINQFSINALPFGSSLFYVHGIFSLFLSCIVIFYFDRFLHKFIHHRTTYLKSQSHNLALRTIFISNIPKEIRTDTALLNYIQSLHIGPVESCFMVRDITTLYQLYTKRKQLIHQLELAHIRIRKNLEDHFKISPCHRPHHESDLSESDDLDLLKQKYHQKSLSWEDIYHLDRHILDHFHPKHYSFHTHEYQYVVDHLLVKLHLTDHEIDLHRKTDFRATDNAFVTFTNMQSHVIAHQCLPSVEHPLVIYKAPEFNNIFWRNLTTRNTTQGIRNIIVSGIYLVLTITWLFLMTTVISLSNFEKVIEILPSFNVPPSYVEYIQQVAPAFIVTLCLAILPYILVAITLIQKCHSYSLIHDIVTYRYFSFSVFNLIFVFNIGQNVFDGIHQVLFANTDRGLLRVIGLSIPNGGYFFINYVVLQMNLHFLELLQFNWALIIKWAREWLVVTPRHLERTRRPYQFLFFYFYPTHALIFMIVILYAILHPLIVLAGALYFVIAYVIFKHQFIFAYVQSYDSYGQVFPNIYRWGLYSLLIQQVILFSVLLTKEAVGASAFVMMSFLLTCYYLYSIRLHLRQATSHK